MPRIGVAAPIIVLIGRLLQGFSAGVELGGVSVYLSEIATPGNRGFYTSFQSSSQQVAIFVAAIIGFALNEIDAGRHDRGLGLAHSVLHRLPDHSLHLLAAPNAGGNAGIPGHEETSFHVAKSSLPRRSNWKIIVLGMMLAALTTMTFYFVTVYTPTFGKTVLKLTGQDALLVTLLVAVTNFIWNPVGGALSDRIGRKPVLLAIASLSLVTAYPALHWLVAAPDLRQDAGGRNDVLVLFRRLQRHHAGRAGRGRAGACPHHLFLAGLRAGGGAVRHLHAVCLDLADQAHRRQGLSRLTG